MCLTNDTCPLGGAMLISGVTLSHNRALGEGGGLYLGYLANVSLQSLTATDNTAGICFSLV
jgi:hypothetical protein